MGRKPDGFGFIAGPSPPGNNATAMPPWYNTEACYYGVIMRWCCSALREVDHR